MKVIIVGGVAGGASCAARLRRLDEKAEILMVERGPYVSYANCGLPYHVSGVIPDESSLLVATEQMFRPAGRRGRGGRCPFFSGERWGRAWPSARPCLVPERPSRRPSWAK
jgi:flavin-dependent dehydrogenase